MDIFNDQQWNKWKTLVTVVSCLHGSESRLYQESNLHSNHRTPWARSVQPVPRHGRSVTPAHPGGEGVWNGCVQEVLAQPCHAGAAHCVQRSRNRSVHRYWSDPQTPQAAHSFNRVSLQVQPTSWLKNFLITTWSWSGVGVWREGVQWGRSGPSSFWLMIPVWCLMQSTLTRTSTSNFGVTCFHFMSLSNITSVLTSTDYRLRTTEQPSHQCLINITKCNWCTEVTETRCVLFYIILSTHFILFYYILLYCI